MKLTEKTKNILEKVGLGVASVLGGIILIVAIYFLGKGIYYVGDRIYEHFAVSQEYEVSDSLYCIVYKDGTISVAQKSTDKKVGKRYWLVWSAEDGDETVMVMDKKDRKGLISAVTGELLIPCEYEMIGSANNRFHLVACLTEKNELGFINYKTGEIGIPFRAYSEFVSDEAVHFDENYCIVQERNAWAIIDSVGNFKLKNCDEIELIGNFYLVHSHGEVQLFDVQNLDCLLSGLKDISINSTGIVCVDSTHTYLMDPTASKVLCDMVFDADEYNYGINDLVESYAEVEYKLPQPQYSVFSMGGKEGVFDGNLEVIIEPQWESISYQGNGLFEAQMDDNAHSVLLDAKGNMVQRKK